MWQELKIPPELQKSVEFYDEILVRIEGDEVLKKDEEFRNVIEGVIGKFEEGEWKEALHPERTTLEHRGEQCICSKHISELCFIQHIPTGQIVRVGSECIKKISEKLYLEVQGRACKKCKDKIDKRTKSGREDLCDDCYKIQEEKEEEERRERRRQEYARIEAERIAKLRKCEDCGWTLSEGSSSSKCFRCFSSSMRRCELCGQNNIDRSKPEYHTKCYSCWKSSLPYSKHKISH